ncbi:MAG TPA: hypothetical protein VN704_01770 [Verrucomicrobiae bacterium]|nr:hypothetical protein [Verrucomicrobiae bacterium]
MEKYVSGNVQTKTVFSIKVGDDDATTIRYHQNWLAMMRYRIKK